MKKKAELKEYAVLGDLKRKIDSLKVNQRNKESRDANGYLHALQQFRPSDSGISLLVQ